MWVFTVIATVSGLAGLGLSVRNYWLLRYKPIHERQSKLQTGLKKMLRLVDEHHFEKALIQLATDMPSDSAKEQLVNLIDLLRPQTNDYLAPTPQQMECFLATVQAAVDEWDELLKPPTDDRILFSGNPEGRQRLAAKLELVRSDVCCIVDGITRIEKKPLGTRKQTQLFRALEGEQRQTALTS